MEKNAIPKRKPAALSPNENLAHIAISALAISNAAERLLRNAGAKYGLTDWALLQKLSTQDEAQPMGRLAQQLGMTRQRIQTQIDALADAKLVDVQGIADDKRVRNISLTQQGRTALTAIVALWTANLAKSDIAITAIKLDAVRLRIDRVSLLLGRSVNRTIAATRKPPK